MEKELTEIGKLTERISRDPKSKLFVPLAEEYKKAGDIEMAIHVLSEGLKHNPSYMTAKTALGRLLLDHGDIAAAKKEFEEVVKAAPDNLVAQRKLGDLYSSQGDTSSALTHYKTVLSLNPRDAEVKSLVASLSGGQAALTSAAPQHDAQPARQAVASAPKKDEELAAAPTQKSAPPVLSAAVSDMNPVKIESAPVTGPVAPTFTRVGEVEEPEEVLFVEPLEIPGEPVAAVSSTEEISPLPEPAAEKPASEELAPEHHEEVLHPDIAQEPQIADTAPAASKTEFFTTEDEILFAFDQPHGEEKPAETVKEHAEEAPSSEMPSPHAGPADDFFGSEPPIEPLMHEPVSENEEPVFARRQEQEHVHLEPEHTIDILPDEISEEPVAHEQATSARESGTDILAEEAPHEIEFMEHASAVEYSSAAVSQEPAPVETPAAEPSAEQPAAKTAAADDITTNTLAELCIAQGFFEKAIDIYRRMAADHPQSKELLDKLAQVNAMASEAGVSLAKPAAEAGEESVVTSRAPETKAPLDVPPAAKSIFEDAREFVPPSEETIELGYFGEPAEPASAEPAKSADAGQQHLADAQDFALDSTSLFEEKAPSTRKSDAGAPAAEFSEQMPEAAVPASKPVTQESLAEEVTYDIFMEDAAQQHVSVKNGGDGYTPQPYIPSASPAGREPGPHFGTGAIAAKQEKIERLEKWLRTIMKEK
jgi:tetratricopeptide (TPR) repeat protein